MCGGFWNTGPTIFLDEPLISYRCSLKTGDRLRHLSDITIPATGRPSLLLTALPWELRDQIYEYALIEEGGVVKDDVFTTEGAGRFYAAGEFNTITPLDTFYH
jgi:hypothetical protein